MTRPGSSFCTSPRLSGTILALALALGASACDKGSSASAAPEDGAAGQDAVPSAGGEAYRYADDFTLTAETKLEVDLTTSEGSGAAELQARSQIEAKPAGDKLEVHGKLIELVDFTGSGNLDPEFMKKQAEEQGQTDFDFLAELRASEAWSIVDHKGETDDDATKGLPQNQGSDDSGADFGLFELPDLPAVDLEVGKTVTLPTYEEPRQMPFGEIPMEIDESWTLRGIDESGGKHIAEFDVTVEGSGATELSGQGQTAMISSLEESAFTIFFDIDAGLPVSISGYSQSETTIDAGGQSFSFATNSELETTYSVGAAAPAPAETAPAEDAAGAPAEDAPAE
ncbi:hypothetical protein G6O69_08710 [Pseudenhygromyxa sp. WMMC2535]|uniref:hypothetical protein n=1 Tax=Pseudenhygromyxa sp. WMMC2535 TaxID=2712867 RepID=UPI001556F1BD|nr:hypothetical protein [Pseudenhygromyxa sp. WMMC2535]NVB37914.1 hypothetical protein [Pseudenhygromyxa sp. WMMC2535]